ncbi:hypothetical protein [Allomesorhizobium camelthorni]|uniref:Uncharacterized protein n=1 Tax=Allomesorhizobium camelthorni TaxID=475069 RepID=A0A6G4WBI0_9HYPH|nr:hypothetical protein [Mesorhizobium camelthorni]NGO51563.1 hypothetical protein [Mesorhizobium camelthorni]
MENDDDLEESGLEDDDSLQTVEAQALQQFDTDESGGWECRKILNDWFVKLQARAGDDDAQYRREIRDAIDVLNDIHWAINTGGIIPDPDDGKKRYVGRRLWVWPSDEDIRHPPKNWIGDRSPVRSDLLDKALAKYLKRPWLQHDIIDGSVINALLFTELAEVSEQVRVGAATGTPNWSYILSDGNELAQLGWAIALPIVGFLARWVLLPAVSIGLLIYRFQTAAIVVIGLWALYVLYRLVVIPARWRRRKVRREAAVKADEIIQAMLHAWLAARGSTINPTRLKELVKVAEERGAAFRPVLHTLIDRAIQRDPTALVTE